MAPPSTSSHFPSSEMFDTLIRIEVSTDEDKQIFDVYHGVLCFYSGFFNIALSGPWKEPQDQLVRLPEADPRMFALLTHWIHTRCFFSSTLDPGTLMSFTTLVKLWVLADVLDIPMLQNEIVDLILKKMRATRRCMDEEAITYVHNNNTSDNSALRRMTHESIIAVIRDTANESAFDFRDLNDSVDFAWFIELLKLCEIGERSSLDEMFKQLNSVQRRCQWHIHSNGTTCSAQVDGIISSERPRRLGRHGANATKSRTVESGGDTDE